MRGGNLCLFKFHVLALTVGFLVGLDLGSAVGVVDPVLPIAAVTASSWEAANVPANTIDGDFGTRWSAFGDGQWIQYDLGVATMTVSQVTIAWYQGKWRKSRFDVEVSKNGTTWTRVFSGTSRGRTLDPEAYDVADVTARYIRIVGYGNSMNNWNSITEVAIYGRQNQPALPILAVVASSWEAANVPANTIDNNFGTRWSASGDGQWIQYVLAATNVAVHRVSIAWYQGDRRTSRFDLEVSTNGTTWTRVFSGTSSGTTLHLEPYDIVAVPAQYVRIVGHGNSINNWNSITEVAIYGTAEASNVALDGLEVTQAIQDMTHAVPLIANKRTVVRVYLSSRSSHPMTVRGTITVTRISSHGTSITLNAINTVFVDPAQNGQLRLKRENINASLNFLLPAQWTGVGNVRLRVSSITEAATGATVICTNCTTHPAVVRFVDSAPLRVHIIGLRFTTDTPSTSYAPSILDFDLIRSWLKRAYPVAEVEFSRVTTNATDAWPFDCGQANAQVAAMRSLDIAGGTDARTHYYGLVPDGGDARYFMRGCAAGIPSTPNPAVVASGPTGPGSWGWDVDGSYGDWYAGHELGHTFGRFHIGSGCGESYDDPYYPFPNGQLSRDDGAFVGFDVGDASLGIPMAALPGVIWHDVMSYCDRQWLSSYTYQGIRDRLNAEDYSGSDISTLVATNLAATGSAGGRGMPTAAGSAVVEILTASVASGDFLNVVATVNLTRNTGKMRYVQRLAKAVVPTGPQEELAHLRLLDANGTLLGEYPVLVKRNTDIPQGEDQTGLIDAVVPFLPTASAVELVMAGTVVDTLRAGQTPPTVRNLRVPALDRPQGLAAEAVGEPLVLTWEGSAPDNRQVTYSVQVSTDDGETWKTLAIGLTTPRLEIDAEHLQGLWDALLRVIASDGFQSAVVTSQPLRLPKQ